MSLRARTHLETIKRSKGNHAASQGKMMIKTYIRVQLSSEGESPKQIMERMRSIGAVPVVGDYDFELNLGDDERLFDKLEVIHRALRGARVRYTITTRTNLEEGLDGMTRHPVTHVVDQKPVELKKMVYRAKLDRWRVMGLDVSELEPLLDKDLDHFKEASKRFLRTHLDNLSVVKDKHPPENQIDGEVLALLNEEGRSIQDIISLSGYSEDIITLSLGRLISAGSATRCQKESAELFCLVPPPAPPMRKALKILPAQDDAEAEERVRISIQPDGSTKDQIMRASRLPIDQVSTALLSLSKNGKVRVVRKGKRAIFKLM